MASTSARELVRPGSQEPRGIVSIPGDEAHRPRSVLARLLGRIEGTGTERGPEVAPATTRRCQVDRSGGGENAGAATLLLDPNQRRPWENLAAFEGKRCW